MKDLLGHTRMYLSLGFAVLPLHFPFKRDGKLLCSCTRKDCRQPAKHPFGRLVRNGLKDASNDADTVARWFTNTSLNLGIATGADSGVIVLDVDPRHDGDETLAALEQEHGPLPETWRFLTGGGGEHILFRHPGRRVPNSAGTLGEGLDIRGDGGYIVAPPSRHVSGRSYAISVDHHPEDVALADAPDWLLEKITKPPVRGRTKGATPPTDWRTYIKTVHAEGGRNAAVAKLTGHLLRNRIDPIATLDLILCWNQVHCQPPLDEPEITQTVRSIATREIERRRGAHEK